ncbi:MAG TPA: S8 family serine peptidase [Pyrinomonadaceae bacterium]|jgi:subtilisin family serine protease
MKTRLLENFGKRKFFAGLLACLVLTAGFVYFNFYAATVDASGIAKSVIVQLKDEPAAVWKARQQKMGNSVSNEQLQAYRSSITEKQNAFLAALQARGVSYEIDGVDIKDFSGATQMRADYRFNLVLNGITLKVPAAAISIIKSMPQVKSVKPNDYLKLALNKSVPYINAPPVYGQYPELTPFDNFREGYEGQGINIAVLDTGIDWKHEMFGGDPTPPRLGIAPPLAAVGSNQKVIYYLSFTGGLIDDYGHGSAASSDIAGYLGTAPGADGLPGTVDDIRVHGVAPQAKLMGYKVCLGVGSCVSASTILGIEDAVSPTSLTMQPKPIAHVINMSLGGAGGPDSDTAVAADNAALLGTIVVASAGNDGPGEGTIGAPAAGRHVISVGATTDPAAANSTWSADILKASAIPQAVTGPVTPATNLAAQEGFNRIRLYKMAESPDPAAGSIAQRYVLINLADVGATYPASVSGRIALIKDSGLASATFFDICNSAAANGAIGAILISATTNPTAVHGLIPCSIASPTDGEVLIDALSSTDDNAVDPPNGAISEMPIRINPYLNNVFVGETASFSSRGPVEGLGQVKPDVTAPGVAITSATIRAGSADANGGHMFDPTGYVAATGTSFSGPHVAGSVALIKQAHLDWSPDMVRTALINTATNLRTLNGTPKADGATADSINDQGGGLVDVAAAVNTKALMGVEGDGIVEPGILGSHSFGEKAVLNNRINNTFDVSVTIRDVSGQGGTYNLSTVNNRSTDKPGVATSVSTQSINIPAGGSKSFTASISIDGNVVRSTDIQQFQWYVVAQNGNKTLRMPMYLQATPSLPGDTVGSTVTDTYTGTVLASDAGVQRDNNVYLLSDVSYVDVPFTLDASTLKLDATLNWNVNSTPAGVGLPDLDFLLFDPNGNQIGDSANSDAPEHIAANTTIAGTYIYRVYGWAGAATDFEITSTQLKGGAAPVVQAFASDFTKDNARYDFDGNYTINWTPRGAVEGYEVEQSIDGVNWTVAGTTDGNATSGSFSNAADGTYQYRVRAITAGRVGKFVTQPSNVESITVSRRLEVDATSSLSAVNRSITFTTGAAEIVSALKNQSTTTFYPNTRFEIVSIQGNGVKVANADNNGDGVGTTAVFDYSQLVGNSLAPNAESGNKTLRFSNPNNILFTFTARVKSNVLTGGQTTQGQTQGSTTGGTTAPGGGTTSGGTTTTSANGGLTSRLFKFTVNPLTRTVSVTLLQ